MYAYQCKHLFMFSSLINIYLCMPIDQCIKSPIRSSFFSIDRPLSSKLKRINYNLFLNFTATKYILNENRKSSKYFFFASGYSARASHRSSLLKMLSKVCTQKMPLFIGTATIRGRIQCVTVPKMLDDTDTDTFFRY